MLGALATRGGCYVAHPSVQGANGYAAVRFLKVAQIRDHALNVYTFNAGTTLIADRMTSYGQVYCGSAMRNDDEHVIVTCIGVKNETSVVLNPGAFLKEVEREIPLGTIEVVNVKL